MSSHNSQLITHNSKPITHNSFTYLQQLNFKIQSRIWRNYAANRARTVCEVRRNDQLSFTADLHTFDALIPAGNNLFGAENKIKRLIAIEGAVEFRTPLTVHV